MLSGISLIVIFLRTNLFLHSEMSLPSQKKFEFYCGKKPIFTKCQVLIKQDGNLNGFVFWIDTLKKPLFSY